MIRNQNGHIFTVKDAKGRALSYHVRYRITEMQDGKPVRVQKSAKLCDHDDRHHSMTCKAVQGLRRQHMDGVNRMAGASPVDVLISDFWNDTYLPHLQATKKPSTMQGYLKLWEKHLGPALTGISLQKMTCAMATVFLTSLVKEKKLGRRSVQHAHSLGSGLFRHAKQLGLVEQNPFTDAVSHVQAKKPIPTHAYSLDEAENIFNALTGNVQAQLAFCLSTFMGLRPVESSALKWSDIDEDWIHVRRAAWHGIVGETKTQESVASIPMIGLVRSL